MRTKMSQLVCMKAILVFPGFSRQVSGVSGVKSWPLRFLGSVALHCKLDYTTRFHN
jgi:hypothetical protein